jgi:hypothetical protein
MLRRLDLPLAARGRLLTLLLACGLVTPRALLASPEPRLEVASRVHAGEVVEVRWDPRTLGGSEVELVLSLDGGRHFTIHASPELDPATDRYLWRVPNLGAHGAVLALRVGSWQQEAISTRSKGFVIVADPRRSPTRIGLREGVEGFVCEGAAPAPSWGAPRAQFECGGARESAETPPRTVTAEPAPVQIIGCRPTSLRPLPFATREGGTPPLDLKRRN